MCMERVVGALWIKNDVVACECCGGLSASKGSYYDLQWRIAGLLRIGSNQTVDMDPLFASGTTATD
jgi:hypothetical protein